MNHTNPQEEKTLDLIDRLYDALDSDEGGGPGRVMRMIVAEITSAADQELEKVVQYLSNGGSVDGLKSRLHRE